MKGFWQYSSAFIGSLLKKAVQKYKISATNPNFSPCFFIQKSGQAWFTLSGSLHTCSCDSCTSRPETTNMRSLLARLADVARINGYGLATVAAEVAQGETDVEAKPVQALRAQASEVLAVAV